MHTICKQSVNVLFGSIFFNIASAHTSSYLWYFLLMTFRPIGSEENVNIWIAYIMYIKKSRNLAIIFWLTSFY